MKLPLIVNTSLSRVMAILVETQDPRDVVMALRQSFFNVYMSDEDAPPNEETIRFYKWLEELTGRADNLERVKSGQYALMANVRGKFANTNEL